MSEPTYDLKTRLIREATRRPEKRRPVNPPIERATTILVEDSRSLYDESKGVSYGIHGLAPHFALQDALKELEGATDVSLLPSGLSALTLPLLTLLSPGDEALLTDAVYGPTRRFFAHFLARFGIKAVYFPADASPDQVFALATPQTRLIVLESPGSLTFEIQDIPAIAAEARRRHILTLMDNTYGAGLLFRPLDHGIDISVQALSKYVAGHADVLAGAVSVKDPGLAEQLKDSIRDQGLFISPDDAWLALRGLRSMATRVESCGAAGFKVAAFLKSHPKVAKVLHPSFGDTPGHEIFARDFKGANGLFSLVLKSGDADSAHRMIDALKLFGIGYSWGGFESLAIWCDPQLAARAFKPSFAGPLIRIHVGLEAASDLIGDLDQALAQV